MKKQNLTGYIQYYKKMVGQTQRPWVRQKKKFSPTLRNIYKKQHVARPCIPKYLDVPPTMKVKGYMYPQMKKPVGMVLYIVNVTLLLTSYIYTVQGFESGSVPGTFTRLRSCIVPAEITEQCGKPPLANSPKASGNFWWRVTSTLYSPVWRVGT